MDHYNLGVIISVGYRVKPLRGTPFRIWATQTLREHLLRDHVLNEQRLTGSLHEAHKTINLLDGTLRNQALVDDAGQAVLDLITGYADTWSLRKGFNYAHPAHCRERTQQQGSDDPPHHESAGAPRLTPFAAALIFERLIFERRLLRNPDCPSRRRPGTCCKRPIGSS